MTFLGKRFSPQHEGAAESRYNARLQGARARHGLDKAGLKMCDKFGRLPRIETTVRDVSYSTHYRKVEKRHGTTVRRRASVKKTIYSLAALRGLLAAANGRYLEFLAAIEDRRGAGRRLRQLPRSVRQAARHYRRLHFFDEQDEPVLKLIAGGEFQLRGMTNGEARAQLAGRSSGQASRLSKRSRVPGLICKIARRYRYHLTGCGKRVIALACKLRETVVLPELELIRAAA